MATATDQSTQARWFSPPPFGSWLGLVRHVAVGGLSGLAAGFLVGGVGSRVFMRIAGAASGSRGVGRTTEAGFTVGELTVGGSIGLVVFIGLVSGAIGAGMYLAMRPWLDWAGRWRGIAFGILLFGLTSATSDLMNPDNVDFFILGNGPLLIALIFALFVGFGVVTDNVFHRLDRRLPDGSQRWAGIGVVYTAVAAVGSLIVLALGSAVLSGGEGICGCEAPMRASWSFLIVFVSTSVLWIGAVVNAPCWITSAATVTGYGGTIGVLVFGLERALSDAVQIIT